MLSFLVLSESQIKKDNTIFRKFLLAVIICIEKYFISYLL